ncbi:cytochrome P450 716B1-like protein [Salvia divinorum]|uniref:Cytochrome P450 716B1-like protein n=1 Tax=Salvia divinorum TaxID=28513 RepID=A0ABD1HLM1_SALDI
MPFLLPLFLFCLILLLPIYLLLSTTRKLPQNTPPGSFGIPFIGQSLNLLWAMRANTADEWIASRARRYGAVSKLSLFGRPTVFIYGQTANRFVFCGDGSKLSNQQTDSVRMVLGDRCLLELVGEDHKRIRNALSSFLKPDSLKNYIGKMEEEVMMHLHMHWHGKSNIKVMPLMKTLTFNIICSLLFGVERGSVRDTLELYFQEMIEGIWSLPLNLPFTRFNRSLKASAKVKKMLRHLISEKRAQLAAGASSHQDLITCLLTSHGGQLASDDEIIHNVMLVMVAGHDTSTILITFMVRVLANHPEIHAAVLAEQEGIKKGGAFLT